MRKLTLAAYIVGLTLTTVIIAWQGVDVVGAAFHRIGIQLLWLVPYFVIPIGLASFAWRLIFPLGMRPSAVYLFAATWIGMSVNWLLPVAQIGGEIVKSIWLVRRVKPASLIVATAILDKALQAATQALISLIGVAFLLGLRSDLALLPGVLAFAIVILALFAAFILFQRQGLLARIVAVTEPIFVKIMAYRWSARSPDLARLAGGAAAIDTDIRKICGSPRQLCLSLALRLPARLILAVEVWFVFNMLGHPISVSEALMIECIGQTVRAAAFIMPGAYGVQETAYMLLATLVGVPPDVGLTASLTKRIRELLVGVPSLIFLQITEHKLAPIT